MVDQSDDGGGTSDEQRPEAFRQNPDVGRVCFYCGARVDTCDLRSVLVERSGVFVGVMTCAAHAGEAEYAAQGLAEALSTMADLICHGGGDFQRCDDEGTRDECRRLLPELDSLNLCDEERAAMRDAAQQKSGKLWPDQRRLIDEALNRLFPPGVDGGGDVAVDDDGDDSDS